MNKYLALVKEMESQKHKDDTGLPERDWSDVENLQKVPPKGTAKPAKVEKGGFAGFAVGEGDHFQKNVVSPDDIAGLPTDPDSGAIFMPWCAPISPTQFTAWRAELIGLINRLAEFQSWSDGSLSRTLTAAIRGPVSDLLPNLAYFRERVQAMGIPREPGEGTGPC